MKTRLQHPRHVAALFAGIALLLVGTAGAVGVAGSGWLRHAPGAEGGVADQESLRDPMPASVADAKGARRRGGCGECGVIESMRRLAPVGNRPALHEITVRLANGSTRVLSEASPAPWRPGEAAIIIEGWSKPGV